MTTSSLTGGFVTRCVFRQLRAVHVQEYRLAPTGHCPLAMVSSVWSIYPPRSNKSGGAAVELIFYSILALQTGVTATIDINQRLRS